MSSLEIQTYVRIQVTKFSPERHYIPNWNFMLKRRMIWNFTIMFKFKLQDIQREENYIPNWNFMPKKKRKKYFVETKLSDL